MKVVLGFYWHIDQLFSWSAGGGGGFGQCDVGRVGAEVWSEMSNETKIEPRTPSERIAADLPDVELQCAAHVRTTLPPMSDAMWIAFLDDEQNTEVLGGIETGARIICLIRELDREAERRAAWEKSVEDKLESLGSSKT